MSRKALDYPSWMDLAHLAHYFQENFAKWTTATGVAGWTIDGGTITRHASPGAPIVSVTDDNTDNAVGGIIRTDKALQFRDDSPFLFRYRGLFTEAVTTGVANGFIGVSDQAITGILSDNGAGPAASQDGAGFYWKDGSTQLYVWAANGADIFNEALTATNRNNLTGQSILASSSNVRDFQVESKPVRSGVTEVQFKLNGILVARREILTASAAMMAPAVFVKSGDATNEQSIRHYNVTEAQNYSALVSGSPLF